MASVLDPKDVERVLGDATTASHERARSEYFYRQLALHMAREATTEFRLHGAPIELDGAAAVAAFLRHEAESGRIGKDDITTNGQGLHVKADVRACQWASTCKASHRALGEVPQCLRAITLIEAISTKVPDRPPMTYDLAPGLVDGTSDACKISLRPAGVPVEPMERFVRHG